MPDELFSAINNVYISQLYTASFPTLSTLSLYTVNYGGL